MADQSAEPLAQPALLARLRKDAPNQELTSRELRNDVIENLVALFGATNLDTIRTLEAVPEVATSVLNFGVGVGAGQSARGQDGRALATMIKKAILAYEPRLAPSSVRVDVRDMTSEEAVRIGMAGNGLMVEITGEMWTPFGSERLTLRGGVDAVHGELTPF